MSGEYWYFPLTHGAIMALNTTLLRTKLGSPAETILSTAEAAECIAIALREISDNFGRDAMDEEGVTVADQQAYDLPSGVRERCVRDVIWHKQSVASVLGDGFDNTLHAGFVGEGHDGMSGSYLDKAQRRAAIDASKGGWFIENGQIYLDPAPTDSGDKIIVQYKEDFADVDAIPVDLHRHFWWIAMAEAYGIMAAKDAAFLEVGDGSQKIRTTAGKRYLEMEQILRDRFWGKIA